MFLRDLKAQSLPVNPPASRYREQTKINTVKKPTPNAMMDFLTGKFKCQSDDELINSASSMGDMSEIQLHFVLKIQDKEGTGRKLIQYSYISLYEDAIQCLR